MAHEIAKWLGELGLGRYVEAFVDNDIDIRALPLLTESDLRELGVSLGHRKVLLAAAATLGQGAAPAPPASQSAASSAPRPAPTSEADAERRLLSVLFCDMVGSTELARRLDPEDMRELLRGYQDRVAGAVSRYGGHVAQYLGDGVMAFFGWPMAYEDQAERAARAGLEALAAVRSLKTADGGHLEARAAIATGHVVVGDLRAAGRGEGAIAGETPNLAARLQEHGKPNHLVISEATRGLLGASFDIEDLGRRPIKGFDAPQHLFRVAGTRQVESRFDALHGAALSRFVGRVNELALLVERWEQARGGEGQAVLIAGEAGIGKSRLVRALVDHLRGEPHGIWRLQCSPYHPNSALFPVIQNLQRAIGLRNEDTAEERLDKLERTLAETGEGIEAVAPIYAELLSLDSAGRYPSLELTPQQLKNQTLRALIDRCLLIAAKAPVLIIIEDAHWIDPTTRELTEQTIARIATAPVLVVVTHRPEWRCEWASMYGHVFPLALGRLTKPQTAELVESMVGRQGNEKLIADIAARTDGVPLFAEELTRSLVERRADARTQSVEIPATLHGSLMARLDALPPPQKEIMQAASVIGREFDADVLARVCQRERADVDPALDGLATARLVVKGGMSPDTLVFRHALIQDAAYQSLLRSKRQRYHEAIANTLIEMRAETAETQPEVVAYHFTEAGIAEQALSYWRRAGERALARSANYEAVDHFAKAVEVSAKLADASERGRAVLGVRVLLGRAQERSGRMQDAMATFELAVQLAREQGDKSAIVASAIGFEVAQFLSNEPVDRSLELLTEALAAIDDPDGPEACQVMSHLTRTYYMKGMLDRADELSRRTIELARRHDDDHSLLNVLNSRFLVPRGGYTHPEIQQSRAQLEELVRTAQRLPDVNFIGRAQSTDFYYSAQFGDRDHMLHALDAIATLGETRQTVLHSWIAASGRAMVATMVGNFAEAERFAEEAFELGRQSAGEHVDGVYGTQMFTIRREQGRLAEVAPIIKRFVDENPEETAWRPGLALIASDLGYKEPARRILAELAQTGFAFPTDAKRSTSLAYMAEVCAPLEDTTHAETLYGLLEPYLHMTITTGIATACYGSAGRHLGMLADVLGWWDLSEEHFEEALRVNREMQAWPWLAHTQRDLAHMLRRRGRRTDIEHAEALLSEAWATAERLGMIALKGRLRLQQH